MTSHKPTYDVSPLQVLACVALLLEHKVKVKVHDKHHVSPLMMCAQHGYNSALELLCQQNDVEINGQDVVGTYFLVYSGLGIHCFLLNYWNIR